MRRLKRSEEVLAEKLNLTTWFGNVSVYHNIEIEMIDTQGHLSMGMSSRTLYDRLELSSTWEFYNIASDPAIEAVVLFDSYRLLNVIKELPG